MKNLLLIFILVLLNNCAPTYTYRLEYHSNLSNVERNNQSFDIEESSKLSDLFFRDELIEALFSFTNSSIYLNLSNMSGNTISVDWEKSAFINVTNVSEGMNTGLTRGIHSNLSEPPSIIPKNSSINKALFLHSTHTPKMLFYPNSNNILDTELDESLENVRTSFEGEDFRFLLLLETDDTEYEYIFKFTIEQIEAIKNKIPFYSAKPLATPIDTIQNDFILKDLFKKKEKEPND